MTYEHSCGAIETRGTPLVFLPPLLVQVAAIGRRMTEISARYESLTRNLRSSGS